MTFVYKEKKPFIFFQQKKRLCRYEGVNVSNDKFLYIVIVTTLRLDFLKL
jgi:hypothetical protein